MLIPAALGDVVDRVTICLIKTERIEDPVRLAHSKRELEQLQTAWADEGLPPMTALPTYAKLADVNQRLWDVEDALRDCERNQDFGSRFVELARSVYKLNDQRAAHKRAINEHLGSDLVEVKSYAPYAERDLTRS